MKKTVHRLLCTLIAGLIAVSATIPAFAAFSYPAGVTAQTAAQSIEKTDILIRNAVPALTGKGLRDTVYGELYKDATLSQILISVYSALGEQSSALSGAGLEVSPAALADRLAAYPTIAQALTNAASWQDADLSNARWGVTDERAFADAVAAMLSPFNDILYMLLCSGDYNVSFLNLNGADGYNNGILPLLRVLDCTELKSNESFKIEAANNKNSMLANIIVSLLSFFNTVLDAPTATLTRVLPELANYIKNGDFEAGIDALLQPLTLKVGNVRQLFSGTQMLSFLMVLQDPSKFTLQFKNNLAVLLNDAAKNTKIKFPDINLDKLVACRGDAGAAYVVIFRWLIEAAKLNSGKIGAMLPMNESGDMAAKVLDSLLAKETDALLALIVKLFTAAEGMTLDYQWPSGAYTPVSVTYTPNLTRENYQHALEGIDEILNEAIKDMTAYDSIAELLQARIYSNALITTVAKTVYGMLGGDVGSAVSMLGIPAAPYQLANELSGGSFSSARNTLYNHTSWDSVNSVYWGFNDGNRSGFERALTAILRPFRPLLEALLAGGTVELLGSIHIGGSNGYNTAVIPLLEALGCAPNSIQDYNAYIKNRGKDAILTGILDPVLDLVDRISERPVFTLTEILPNALYFIQNDGLTRCIEHLLAPLETMQQEFSIDLNALGFDLTEIKKTDLITTLETTVTEFSDTIKLKKPDLQSLIGMGTQTQMQSKRTYQGAAMTVDYIQADQAAIFITLLRYIVDAIKNPDNGDLLAGFMDGDGDGNAMFSSYAATIGEKMNDMTTDELIEWLYRLFFRDRAIQEAATGDYIPTIIYQSKKRRANLAEPIATAAVVLLMLVIVIIINRRNIADAFLRLRRKRENQKEKTEG
ncbi:MAG: hypothetical protein IJ766_09065 [Clostridia bacterium]|nr:hypothetical protein [Clostridia bacterium]